MVELLSPVLYVFYSEAGKFVGWLYLVLPFNKKYSLTLAYCAGRFKKQAEKLLKQDF